MVDGSLLNGKIVRERRKRERKKGDRFFEAQTEFDGIRVLKRDLKIVIKKK
jgi:hypothetical protein